jgi:hypothetical protein
VSAPITVLTPVATDAAPVLSRDAQSIFEQLIALHVLFARYPDLTLTKIHAICEWLATEHVQWNAGVLDRAYRSTR